MLKPIYIFLLIAAILFTGLTVMLMGGDDNEGLLTGTWQEVRWTFEGVEDSASLAKMSSFTRLNQKLGRDYFHHKNEIWIFDETGHLSLQGDFNGVKRRSLRWIVKGRGNILVLYDGSTPLEYYNISKINRDSLVINYYIELQAKGVAELTFKRVQ